MHHNKKTMDNILYFRNRIQSTIIIHSKIGAGGQIKRARAKRTVYWKMPHELVSTMSGIKKSRMYIARRAQIRCHRVHYFFNRLPSLENSALFSISMAKCVACLVYRFHLQNCRSFTVSAMCFTISVATTSTRRLCMFLLCFVRHRARTPAHLHTGHVVVVLTIYGRPYAEHFLLEKRKVNKENADVCCVH